MWVPQYQAKQRYSYLWFDIFNFFDILLIDVWLSFRTSTATINVIYVVKTKAYTRLNYTTTILTHNDLTYNGNSYTT